MGTNKQTIEKNRIEQSGKVKYWQPIVGKGWCYHTMKSNSSSVRIEKHEWNVQKASLRNTYNT